MSAEKVLKALAVIVLTILIAPWLMLFVWVGMALFLIPPTGWLAVFIATLCIAGTAGAILDSFDKHRDAEDARKLRKAELKKHGL